jgi:hypothetical protein
VAAIFRLRSGGHPERPDPLGFTGCTAMYHYTPSIASVSMRLE